MNLKLAFVALSVALSGNLWADTFSEGTKAYNDKNYGEALSKWKISAQSGDAYAIFNIGGIYYFGLGTQQNYYEALQWYKKATSLDDGNAEFIIGQMYRKGQGVASDLILTKAWLTISALKGNQQATKVIAEIEPKLENHQIVLANHLVEQCKAVQLTLCNF